MDQIGPSIVLGLRRVEGTSAPLPQCNTYTVPVKCTRALSAPSNSRDCGGASLRWTLEDGRHSVVIQAGCCIPFIRLQDEHLAVRGGMETIVLWCSIAINPIQAPTTSLRWQHHVLLPAYPPHYALWNALTVGVATT